MLRYSGEYVRSREAGRFGRACSLVVEPFEIFLVGSVSCRFRTSGWNFFGLQLRLTVSEVGSGTCLLAQNSDFDLVGDFIRTQTVSIMFWR
jgi:hypothetical protein